MKFARTKERIIQYLDYKNVTKKDFYEKTGIKRGFLDTDKLKSNVSDTFITKIIAIYPELSLEWLLTGDGEMLKKKTTSKIDTSTKKLINLKQEYTAERNPQTTAVHENPFQVLNDKIDKLYEMQLKSSESIDLLAETTLKLGAKTVKTEMILNEIKNHLNVSKPQKKNITT